MIDQATWDCHRSNVAKMGTRRPAHGLNDRTVTVAEGAVARSAYKGGSDYLPGIGLLVVAVSGGKVLLAGPHGIAYALESEVREAAL